MHCTGLILKCINPLYTENPYTGTYTNSEDPDEMLLNVAFHQDIQCLSN